MLELAPPLSLATTANQAKVYARAARADATRRAYASDLRDFEAYCTLHNLDVLPAAPQTVALYLTELAGRLKVATVKRRLVAIAQQHRLRGFSPPTAEPIVREIMRGIERTHGTARHKKTALTADLLKDVLHRFDNSLRGRRDRALLLLMFAGGFRRSEVAALDLADLRFERRGGIVTLRRSKTDQVGAGREIAIPQLRTPALCPVHALRAWIEAAGIVAGPLFRTFSMKGELQTNRIDGRDRATGSTADRARSAPRGFCCPQFARRVRDIGCRVWHRRIEFAKRDGTSVGHDPARLRSTSNALRRCAAAANHGRRLIAGDIANEAIAADARQRLG